MPKNQSFLSNVIGLYLPNPYVGLKEIMQILEKQKMKKDLVLV